MFDKVFIMDVAERAIKTAAQFVVVGIGTSVYLGQVNWVLVASSAGLGALLSVLTSIASKGNSDSASLVR